MKFELIMMQSVILFINEFRPYLVFFLCFLKRITALFKTVCVLIDKVPVLDEIKMFDI